jgi:class 3 adenylate cyclase
VEALNKALGTAVLVTEATRVALGDRARLRDCGVIPVKGRNEPVHVHELLDVNAPRPTRRRTRA